MRTLILSLLVLTFLACEKEEPVQQNQQQTNTSSTNNTTSNNNNGGNGSNNNGGNNGSGTTNVDRYLWISLSSDNALNKLDSIVYDDGTGNIINLDSANAQALFSPDGDGHYTNIPVSGQDGYQIDVCIYFKNQPPIGYGFYNFYVDATVGTDPKNYYGSCCPEGTDTYQCYQLEL